ncbi:putative membrane protein [Paenibacillus algorifonticola]|uniref:Putative membrane protein n=1 Tax=Paenibacillus algorifonticola TaxID=684063 RepID=A0A1I2ICZ4_9BACL|nr:YhgE/Pip domain-containing protein [Paenibacillus algorifonticola]SFF39500.1 putative membrane protein [Paenibacillus algorifonticola]
MRNIWHIYKIDWLHILRVPTGIFLILAIILLPGLYDWVNIKSVWDPYSNTQGIKIAVTSLDAGATVQDKTVNIGEELVASLQKNEKLGWTFVGEKEAMDGVEKGTYYASLLIPADFSAKITGIIEGKIERPEVIYTVNEKVNAIAPKITGSGVSAITKQINEGFTEAVSEAVLTKLKEAGVEIEAELPTIRKVENGIFSLESHLPEIEAAGQKVLEIESKLPEINEKAQKMIELQQKLPEINEAAQYVLKLQQYWPKISDAASEVLLIQEKLPEIQKAAQRIQEVDANFDRVSETVDTALDKTNTALGIVTTAEEQLPKLEALGGDAIAFANGLNDFLASSQEAFQTISPTLKQNLLLVKQIADAAELLTARLQEADLSKLPTAAEVQALSDRLSTATGVIGSMTNVLQTINSHLPDGQLGGAIQRLSGLSEKLNTQIQLLGIIKEAMDRGTAPPEEIVARLHTVTAQVSSDLGYVLEHYDSDIVPAITEGLSKLQELGTAASNVLQTAKSKLPDIAELLKAAREGLTFGQQELTRIQAELPEIHMKVHEIATTLQSKTDAFVNAINTAAPFIRNDLPAIGKKIDAAAAFVQNDLPEAEKELAKLADFVKYQLPELTDSVKRVAGLVRDDLPQLEEAIRRAADKLREVKADNSFAELAKLLRGDIEKESEFLASPVLIKENQLYAIPNYGSAMSPFYGVLSLWVGAALLISMLRSEAENPSGSYRGYQLYLGRLGTFLTIGLLQALCVTLGDIFILGAYVADKLWFVLFAMLVSIVFVTITYTLLSVFGNAGKGIAIIFMVFQFSSSGGTFPISMTSPFFQALNPFMPFTYAISLLRESVGGILWETVLKDVLFLLGFIAISLFIALVLKRPLSGIIKRSSDNAKKTKIIA